MKEVRIEDVLIPVLEELLKSYEQNSKREKVMFASLKAKVTGAISSIRDESTFNAAVAATALVGGIDGEWDDEEVDAAIEGLSTHTALKSFSGKVAERVREYEPLATRHSGRAQLKQTIRKAAGSPHAVSIFMLAVDVAEATGGIGEKEVKGLNIVAEALGVTHVQDVKEILTDL